MTYKKSAFFKEYRNKVTVVEKYIDETTSIERLFGIDQISFINADIEGAEYAMLQNMQRIILRDKPVLAIAIYHNKEDIIKIPEYINKLSDSYEFILRKYPNWIGNYMNNHELILYAVPRDRLIYG